MALAKEQGAEMAEGVAAGGAPTHAAAGQAVIDDGFAGALDGTRADLPALAQVVRIVHLVLMITEVVRLATVDFAYRVAFAADIERFQMRAHRRAAFRL